MTSATFRSSRDSDQEVGWANPRVLAIFGVIFLCGAMFGAVGMRAFLHSRMPRSEVRAMDTARAIQIDQMTAKLRLTPEQKRVIIFQLDEYAKYYQNIEEERLDTAQHGVNAIRGVLNEAQRRDFDLMVGLR